MIGKSCVNEKEPKNEYKFNLEYGYVINLEEFIGNFLSHIYRVRSTLKL